MNKVWEDSEKAFIRTNAGQMKDKDLAIKLTKITGRAVSIQAVRKQRQKMGIAKVRGRGRCAILNDKTKHVATPAEIVRAVNQKETDGNALIVGGK